MNGLPGMAATARRARDPGVPAPLRVEFFGLPGSGKTTLARAVHRLLRAAGPDLAFGADLLHDGAPAHVRATAKLALAAAEFARHPGDAGMVRDVLRIPQPGARDRLRAASTVAATVALYRRLDRTGRAAVLDQGMLQALWTVLLRARAPGGPAGALADALADAIVGDAARTSRVHVCLETPPEVCAGRLRARASKHSRMQGRDPAGRRDPWQAGEALRRAIAGRLDLASRDRAAPARIIRVDGTTRPDEAARRIVADLDRLGAGVAPAQAEDEAGLDPPSPVPRRSRGILEERANDRARRGA